jgi:hypothetical protein
VRALVPKRWRQAARTRLRDWTLVEPPPMAAADRRELVRSYREDLLALQDLIGRDLSGWLREAPTA